MNKQQLKEKIEIKICMGFKQYWKELWNRKGHILAGALTALVLFLISGHYLFSGFNKRFIVYTALSFCTGLFFVLPKVKSKFISFLFVILYLVVIPLRVFWRIELPNCDMSGLMPGAQFANVMIILAVYCIFLLVFQRTGIAFAAGNFLLLCLMIINHFCNLFRGSGLTFLDLRATGTALSVLDNYRLTMSGELWYSILYFCFFIAWGFWCDFPMKGIRYHVAVTAVALAGCLAFWFFWEKSGYLEKKGLSGHYWSSTENERVNGFLLGFMIGMDELHMSKPAGYSEARLLDIGEWADEHYQGLEAEEKKPNIIFIMNEAWSDLRVLGNLETTEEFMPFVDSLNGSVTKGNTYVKILGGLTANSEFEALTGDSLAFLAPADIPYALQVNHDMSSLARVLGEQGYQTYGMHPSGANAWNREKAYQYFGFDDFIDQGEFQTPYLYVGNFLSDECNFNEIIWHFEHRDKGQPFFLFDVTIQNHADYYGQVETPIKIKKVGNVAAEEAGYLFDAETYLNLMKITDEAFSNLIGYFEKVDEPVIICMFGDHQPNLGNDFYNAMFEGSGLTEQEQTERKYITPYVIWANYELDIPEYGDMSANYLGTVLLECAGVKLPAYYKFLLEIRKKYPVISRQMVQESGQETELLQYQMLQYNQLMERKYLKEIFSVSD